MGKFDGILLLSDFDRTLTGKDGKVPACNIDAIRYFKDNGGKFSIDTGRSASLFRPKLEQCHINAPAVLNNGALCYDFEKEETVFSSPLDGGIWTFMDTLRERFPQFNYEVQGLNGHAVYSVEQTRLEQLTDHRVRFYEKPFCEVDDPVYMGVVLGHFVRPTDTSASFRDIVTENDRIFVDCERFIEENTDYSPVRSTNELLEFMNHGITKGSGAVRLKEVLGADLLVCVGDALNDTSMVRMADLGFMPCDGDSRFFPLAGEKMQLCASSDDGAIADIVERLEKYGK